MEIAVAMVIDPGGRMLLVRKRGTRAFMQPGGKIEIGEDASVALSRELAEELDLMLPIGQLQYLGSASAPAANEPGVTVKAQVFFVRIDQEISVRAEIEEARWINTANPGGLELAPLTRDHILPLAGAMA